MKSIFRVISSTCLGLAYFVNTVNSSNNSLLNTVVAALIMTGVLSFLWILDQNHIEVKKAIKESKS